MNNKWHFLTNSRSFGAFMYDVGMAFAAWTLSFLFRFNFEIPANFKVHLIETVYLVMFVQACVFVLFGLYEGVWRFASIPDLKRIIKAVSVGAIAVAAILLMIHPTTVVPRTVLILDPILLLLLMGGARFAYRAWKEHKLYGGAEALGKPVLVLGAGDAAIALMKDLARSEAWQVVGLLDDNSALQKREIFGVKVIGVIKDLPQLAAEHQVEHVIIAMPSAQNKARRLAVEIANEAGLAVLTVPAFDDLISGKLSVSQIRKVEVEDLLGREPVELDIEGLHDLIENRVVFVSGAGGSIGSELCRQILKYHPVKLVCLDISEYALYRIEQEFNGAHTEIIYVTADVKNSQRIKSLLQLHQPTVVFHAAAYKHVPLMENRNVAEALSNNVVGTFVLATACKEAEVEKFVLISTDKAVNPTNVMGASKRLAEMVCQGLQEPLNKARTRFVIVRFGNVLGSSGSVIPKFREQIAKGGPVTVTHPDITRYFMSIPEAAQLVMQAGVMGNGAEIFVLDMGEPVKIANLARDMIHLSGLHEDEIKIVFTGLRPGEKLYEELLADDEHTIPTPNHKLRIAVARSANMTWVKKLIKWIESVQGTDELVIKQELKMWVEEYTADNTSSKETRILPEATTIH
jgi:FlaA1/EpsC-like NDP-sugar epimerase